MLNYLTVFAGALGATVLAMPLAHLLGKRMNAWDAPDTLSHSGHDRHITRTGGIAIAAGIYVGILFATMFKPWLFVNRCLSGVLVGGLVVFVTGLLDDLHEIRPWLKATLLLIACLIAAIVMPHILLTGYERLDFLLAVIILMGGTNAFNLMDGMDGLAAGMAVTAGLGLVAISLQMHTAFGAMMILAAMGAAGGFLLFNRPPAKIFMGDCGSLLLGFYITLMALNAVAGFRIFIIPVLLVLSPFILDTGLAIVRRLLGKKDIFTGDRKHAYDLLHDRIASVWRVDWLMWGLGLLFSALGWASTFLGPWQQAALLAVSWLAFIAAMVRLGMFIPESPGLPEESRKWSREPKE